MHARRRVFLTCACRLLPLPCVANPPPIFEVAHMVCPRAPFAAPAAGGARAGLRNTGKIKHLPASHTKEAEKHLVKLNRKPSDQSVSGFNLTRFWGSIFGDAAWVLQAFSTCAPISVTLPGCYWHSLCLPLSRLRGLGDTGILFVCSHLGHAARPSL